jgi:CheY-like chemotaxis protein
MGPSFPLVLIVDDNALNRKLVTDVLGAARFRTLEAASAAEAIALATEQQPDVILMDLRLPDADGIDAVRALAAGVRTSRIPVVAMSALRLEPTDAWLSGAGFAGSIPKPFDVDDLPGLVRGFAERAHD